MVNVVILVFLGNYTIKLEKKTLAKLVYLIKI